ncbi:MAG: hypothetical protein JWN44_1688 [Myxococcales bacterium]|nr:hypothetical protein [Myxococcales bacterium]
MNYLKIAFVSTLLATAGCSFNVNGSTTDATTDVDMSTDPDMPTADVDMVLPTDVDMANPATACVAGSVQCSAGSLQTCRSDGSGYDTTTCALGCVSASPHCAQFQPTAPITRDDFNTTGLTANVVIAGGTTFDTDTGQIGFGTVVRGPNVTPANREVIAGIGFRSVDIPGGSATNPPAKIGIWYFNGVTFQANATLDRVIGANAMGLVSATTMAIDSAFDLTCAGNVFVAAGAGPNAAGPGGGRGAAAAEAKGVGTGGGGSDLNNASGGGGAGYGDAGNVGGKEAANAGGTAGGTYGNVSLSPVLGGSGGGLGGNGTGVGGGGGGAIQAVAQTSLTIGSGNMSAGINASGCGGKVGGGNNGGGGGGSGGGILLESPTISLGPMATLAANGGGGASGDNANTTNNGQSGQFSGARANGGNATPKGGAGGASVTTTGDVGSDDPKAGAGAGGGAGRIRLNSKTGVATVDNSAVISPRPADALTTQGTIATN